MLVLATHACTFSLNVLGSIAMKLKAGKDPGVVGAVQRGAFRPRGFESRLWARVEGSGAFLVWLRVPGSFSGFGSWGLGLFMQQAAERCAADVECRQLVFCACSA